MAPLMGEGVAEARRWRGLRREGGGERGLQREGSGIPSGHRERSQPPAFDRSGAVFDEGGSPAGGISCVAPAHQCTGTAAGHFMFCSFSRIDATLVNLSCDFDRWP